VPWYRTDQNGTITLRSPGIPHGSFTITAERSGTNLSGPGDRTSSQEKCTEPAAVAAQRRSETNVSAFVSF
jgi:hypothetical protein